MSQNFFRFFVVGLLLIIAVSFYRYANGSTPSAAGGYSKEQIVEIIGETLQQKPEMIITALEQYRKNSALKEDEKRQSSLALVKPELMLAKFFPVLGDPNAPITIYEFLDYNCGYCKMVAPILNKIVEKHKDVRFVILDSPILAPSSEDAARAALAANKQGKFRAMHDAMMEHKGALSKETILSLAAKAGLNVETLKADMASDEVTKILDASRGFAQRLQLNGTPSFLVGDEFIPGAIGEEDLLKKIDAIRKAQTKTKP